MHNRHITHTTHTTQTTHMSNHNTFIARILKVYLEQTEKEQVHGEGWPGLHWLKSLYGEKKLREEGGYKIRLDDWINFIVDDNYDVDREVGEIKGRLVEKLKEERSMMEKRLEPLIADKKDTCARMHEKYTIQFKKMSEVERVAMKAEIEEMENSVYVLGEPLAQLRALMYLVDKA